MTTFSSSVFDFPGSLERMGNDVQLFREMIDFLTADSPSLLANAQQGAAVGDWNSVLLAAHSLKGLSANFGGDRAMTAAAIVEQLAKDCASPQTSASSPTASPTQPPSSSPQTPVENEPVCEDVTAKLHELENSVVELCAALKHWAANGRDTHGRDTNGRDADGRDVDGRDVNGRYATGW